MSETQPHPNQLKIAWLGGNCPVQAEGTVGGKPFYFRARGEHWSMGIGGDPVGHPSDPEDERPEWHRQRAWGDGPFAAGWMEEDEARRLIEECAADYLAGKPGEPQ